MPSFGQTYLELAGRALSKKLERHRKPRLPKQRAPRVPLQQEREYQRELAIYVGVIASVFRESLLPILPSLMNTNESTRPTNLKTDAAADDVFRVLNSIPVLIEERYSTDQLRRQAQARGLSLSQWNAKTIKENIKKVIGIDPLMSDAFLPNEIATFTAFNVSLAESLKSEAVNKVSSMVYSGLQSGQRAEDLAKEINKFIDPSVGNIRARANLIARDQINKLNGGLTQLRQSDLGITRYRWRTMGDSLVRDSHREKDGEIFSWDDPPADTGHPGEDFQCRCYAEPVLEDLVPGFDDLVPDLIDE